jgi:hypothetical protein
MQRRHRRRLSLRHWLGAMAVVAALVPMGAAADSTPTVDLNGIADTVFSTVPDGTTIQTTLATAGSKATVCTIEYYLNRMVVAAEYGDKVNCGSSVVSIDSKAAACDGLLGNCSDAAVCGPIAGDSCSNDGVLAPSLIDDQVTLLITVDAYAMRGWTWTNPPSGCKPSGNALHCTITHVFAGPLGSVVPSL